ncbi:MAG: hypothetical protein BWY83_00701 [bacterium ADurb.Bin478]|nr:MAG: hypothetical protein BWY83_00701 [bacterium ADurb.Bin478]
MFRRSVIPFIRRARQRLEHTVDDKRIRCGHIEPAHPVSVFLLPILDRLAAGDHRVFTRISRPGDKMLFQLMKLKRTGRQVRLYALAAVLRRELQGTVKRVIPITDIDQNILAFAKGVGRTDKPLFNRSDLGFIDALFQRANRVLRPRQRGKRPVGFRGVGFCQSAGPVVISVHGHIKVRLLPLSAKPLPVFPS